MLNVYSFPPPKVSRPVRNTRALPALSPVQSETRRNPVDEVFSHDAFWNILERECERRAQFGGCLSLILLRWERTSDNHHSAVAGYIFQALRTLNLRRTSDYYAIYDQGIAVLMPETRASGACVLAQRLVRALRGVYKENRSIKVFAGIASIPLHGTTAPEAIRAAEAAVAEAMRRNQRTVLCSHVFHRSNAVSV